MVDAEEYSSLRAKYERVKKAYLAARKEIKHLKKELCHANACLCADGTLNNSVLMSVKDGKEGVVVGNPKVTPLCTSPAKMSSLMLHAFGSPQDMPLTASHCFQAEPAMQNDEKQSSKLLMLEPTPPDAHPQPHNLRHPFALGDVDFPSSLSPYFPLTDGGRCVILPNSTALPPIVSFLHIETQLEETVPNGPNTSVSPSSVPNRNEHMNEVPLTTCRVASVHMTEFHEVFSPRTPPIPVTYSPNSEDEQENIDASLDLTQPPCVLRKCSYNETTRARTKRAPERENEISPVCLCESSGNCIVPADVVDLCTPDASHAVGIERSRQSNIHRIAPIDVNNSSEVTTADTGHHLDHPTQAYPPGIPPLSLDAINMPHVDQKNISNPANMNFDPAQRTAAMQQNSLQDAGNNTEGGQENRIFYKHLQVGKAPPALLCPAAPTGGAGSWTHAARRPPVTQAPGHARPTATNHIAAISTKYSRKRAKVAGKITEFLRPSRSPSPDITLSSASAGPCVEPQGTNSHNADTCIRSHVEDPDLDLDIVRGVKTATVPKRKHQLTGFEPTRKDLMQVARKDPALNQANRPLMAAQQHARLASNSTERRTVQAAAEAILPHRSWEVDMDGGQCITGNQLQACDRGVQLRQKDSSSRVPSAMLSGDRVSDLDALESGHLAHSTYPSEDKPHSSSNHALPQLPVHQAPPSVAGVPMYCNSTGADAAQNSGLGLSLVPGPQVAGRGMRASHPYACNTSASESKPVASSGHAPPPLLGVGTHGSTDNVPMHDNGNSSAADAAQGSGQGCSVLPDPQVAGRESAAAWRSGGAAADSSGCVPGTSATYAQAGGGARGPTTGGSASGHGNGTAGATEGAHGRGFKYSEVVRGQERSDLAAIACACCRAFYEAVSSWGVGGKHGEPLLQPSCGHQLRGPQMETAGAPSVGPQLQQQHQLVQAGSRHRFRYAPPPTPDGFWDLGFHDSLDSRQQYDGFG